MRLMKSTELKEEIGIKSIGTFKLNLFNCIGDRSVVFIMWHFTKFSKKLINNLLANLVESSHAKNQQILL